MTDCVSIEPGYYEDGFYGVRLETLVGIVKVDTPVRLKFLQQLLINYNDTLSTALLELILQKVEPMNGIISMILIFL